MSRRATRPKPATRRGRLSDAQVVARIDAFEKPPGHPQRTVFRQMPDSRHIHELKSLFNKSGVLLYLERRFRRSGPKSRLKILTLLIAWFYVAGENNNYWRSNMARFLASLHPQDAVDLGVQPPDVVLKPISYSVVCKQSERIEKGLREGWIDETDGTRCDLRWFATRLLRASVPPPIAHQVEAVAMDATDIASWARRFKNPDAQGRHGRDPDATLSHRSGNSEHSKGFFYGYFLTPCIAVKRRIVTGNHKKAKFGDDVPAYVVSMILDTAGASVANTGHDAVMDALDLCPNISDVAVDRGYSQLGPTFNRAMHGMGIHVTMDYKQTALKVAKPVRLGPSRYPAFEHAGTFLHAYTPPEWRVPPEGFNDEQLQEFYAERAKRYALIVHAHLDGGAKRFRSPVHDGRLNIDPDRRTGLNGRPLHPPPTDLHEIFGDVPHEIFLQGLISVPVEQLDHHQMPLPGTPPQVESYNRRPNSENIFSQVKEASGLSKKQNRTMGIAGRYIACAARLIWNNLKITRNSEAEFKAEKRARRTANKTQPEAYTAEGPDDSTQPTSSDSADDKPDSPARPPPPT